MSNTSYYPSLTTRAVIPSTFINTAAVPKMDSATSYSVIPYQPPIVAPPPAVSYPVSTYVYQPGSVPVGNVGGYAGPLIVPPAYGPVIPVMEKERTWLYHLEEDHYPKHEEPYRPVPERKIMYTGALPRAMLSEAYLCAHLSHQTKEGTPVMPGETFQLNSSTGRTTRLTCVNNSIETPDMSWRLLTDGYTNYLIFRGADDYLYAIHDSRQAVLHDIYRGTSVKVHNLFLHQVIPQLQTILTSLDSNAQARRLVIAGHGNGGAYAVICFLLLQRAGYARKQIIVYTFGAPLVMCGSLKPDRPLPKEITHSLYNFVNEDDIVPCLLGNKDLHMVDLLVSTDPVHENPYKTGRHDVHELLAYRPVGKFYYFTRMNTMVDVPQDRLRFFLNVNRGSSVLSVRVHHHEVTSYVSKLRNVVTDN
jgi:hypothetical protein